MLFATLKSFGGIQFNTALKHEVTDLQIGDRFGGIQFNTALKQNSCDGISFTSFGGIQFNTALKLLLNR